tara:strand:- start:68 stop:787 length:720 start_codon:yes stop_codon:yes gene_type:complete
MSLSLIIPVHNEENQIKTTLNRLIKFHKTFKDLEIIFINDFSTDDTKKIIKKIQKKRKFLKYFENKKKGLGSAIQTGITNSRKKFVCIFMADMSDDLKDVKKYYLKINNNKLDAVLGTRFSSKSKVSNYPLFKLVLNRIFNTFVKLLFFTNYNDFTNAFKIYKKKTLLKLLPIVSENFNVFLEIPLKIIIRNYKYDIIPINWRNRKIGRSKFKIKELSSMYLFTMFYCLLEKILLNKKK